MRFEVIDVPPRLRTTVSVGKVFSVAQAAQFFEQNAAQLYQRSYAASFVKFSDISLKIILEPCDYRDHD